VIYICIPALDEAQTVGVLLWKVRKVMADFPREYHLLVLDDGSRDGTREVLEPYTQVLPLTVLRNERTQGYAAALERLLREAVALSTHPKRDVVVVLQADFTESPDDIPLLLKKVEGGADVVGTEVVAAEGEPTRGMRWSRRGLPWLLRGGAFPRDAKNPLSGFRAYRVAVLRRAFGAQDGKPLLTAGGWAANAELLLAVAPHVRRADAAEVSLRYTRRERETRFHAWGAVRAVWDVARKAPRRGRGPEPAQPAAAAPSPAVAAALEEEPAEAAPPPPRRNRGSRRRGGSGRGRKPRPESPGPQENEGA
jgi:glycosyltransferase involved in cell wall biosynthesis